MLLSQLERMSKSQRKKETIIFSEQVASFSKTLVPIYKTMKYHILQDHFLHIYHNEKASLINSRTSHHVLSSQASVSASSDNLDVSSCHLHVKMVIPCVEMKAFFCL